LLLVVSATVNAFPRRNEKLVGLFNYVTFPNDVCVGDGTLVGSANLGNLNGNCYTKQECDALGGSAAGECAEGYGVCCVFRPSCGETIKQNLSYFIQTETQAPTENFCSYTICPVASDVNRIRLDLRTFIIGGPVGLTDTDGDDDAGTAAASRNSVGTCATDTFVVSRTGKGSPVICGTNTGQHMIVDTDGETCVTATFSFGFDAITREYEIRALQYENTNKLGGPEGCLQYYIGETATVTTFNWGGTARTSTHLSNQNYDICVRRARGFCGICWTPSTMGTSGTTLGSFGLSVSPDAASKSALGATCTTDYIGIPNGVDATDTSTTIDAAGNNKFCGRYLNPATAPATADAAVCSNVTPFTLSVVTNANEAFGATNDAQNNEAWATGTSPLGTMGFSLTFTQQACQ